MSGSLPQVPFADRLADAVRARGTPVLVGLDPRTEQLPAGLAPEPDADWAAQASAYRAFCRGVIDVVAPLVPAVKPQAAFFEALGPAGMTALKDVVDYARAGTPGHPGRQAQRHRLDGRSLRSGLVGHAR